MEVYIMANRYVTFGVGRIVNLAQQAERGDEKALNQLINYTSKQAEIANKRVATLEKAGRTKWAYTSAKNWQKYYHINEFETDADKLRNDIKFLKAQALELQGLNKMETFTLAGQKRVEKASLERLEKIAGTKLPVTRNEKGQFTSARDDVVKALNSYEFKYYKKHMDSTQLIKDLFSVAETGEDVYAKVKDAFRALARSQSETAEGTWERSVRTWDDI